MKLVTKPKLPERDCSICASSCLQMERALSNSSGINPFSATSVTWSLGSSNTTRLRSVGRVDVATSHCRIDVCHAMRKMTTVSSVRNNETKCDSTCQRRRMHEKTHALHIKEKLKASLNSNCHGAWHDKTIMHKKECAENTRVANRLKTEKCAVSCGILHSLPREDLDWPFLRDGSRSGDLEC